MTEQLPTLLSQFLADHAARRADDAGRAFTPDAVITDQGETWRGTEAVLDFLAHAGAEFEYTTELLEVQRVDAEHWVATLRIEGNFPGGTADLDYRFTLDGDLVAALDIVPR